MVEVNVSYEGELHCSIRHEPSGTIVSTDAPKDNHGRGESFSPTDLVAAGLGGCMMTVMGITARAHNWRLDGGTVRVEKEMTQSGPRRITRLTVTFQFPESTARALDEEARATLEQAAHTCPVRLSILDAIEVPTQFNWG